ncbi:hypothetical protein NE237_032599 [Protea cynaroides]|uniref:ADP-ribosyl cyclase/cyclic ADP-ribose hydrolase n=1 Tax=Protea cynaroides TaxID=273540 RepID=A0A9Q0R3M5_9MAGN|nr:hypothetical protein NE237_032599 [Protea cynaroides]
MATHDGSSSSSTSGSFTYHVFLNFRGIDTRNNFTGFLHRALKRERINVFMDNEDLCAGEEIRPALLKAIRQSKISIPIFSKNYADSKWCILELVEIVRCYRINGQIILPIFFDVEPTEVRHQTGSFEESFKKHKEKFDAQTLESWVEALMAAGGIRGYTLKQVYGYPPQLVDIVVDRVLSGLQSNQFTVIKNPLRLDERVHDLSSLSKRATPRKCPVRFKSITSVGIHRRGVDEIKISCLKELSVYLKAMLVPMLTPKVADLDSLQFIELDPWGLHEYHVEFLPSNRCNHMPCRPAERRLMGYLRRLVPGCQKLCVIEVFEKANDYILVLKMKVRVLKTLNQLCSAYSTRLLPPPLPMGVSPLRFFDSESPRFHEELTN